MSIEIQTPLQAWLEERKTFIGASESPAILGVGYATESPWSVWARKVGIEQEAITDELLDCFEWGHAMQPVAISMFEKRTGLICRNLGEFTVQRHPYFPWMGATLDAVTTDEDGLAVVEIKNVGEHNGDDWKGDEPPLRVSVQLQHQMAVYGVTHGYAVAAVGGAKLRWHRMERNEAFIAAMIPRLEQFWGLVKSQTPPEADASEACRQVLLKLHPADSGGVVELPDEADKWDRQLRRAKEHVKKCQQIIDLRENQIKDALGEATFGTLPSGGRYSWKTQTRKAHTVTHDENTTRVLRRHKR